MLVKKSDRQIPQTLFKLQLKKYLISTTKMEYKKPLLPFNFQELADVESIVYEESQIRDVLSKKKYPDYCKQNIG